MDHFDDLLVPNAVAASITAANKKQLFQKLGALAASAYDLDVDDVVDRLTERERLGSTGFGGGIAIPHAKLMQIDKVCGAVVRLESPIPFDSVDESPVDIVFMLLSPVDSGAEHLKTLARVSRFLRNETHLARMRGASSDAALFALLSGGETRDAA
jgi:PTS system nitrogen regulatory IIA component